jgi:hypothetical protein
MEAVGVKIKIDQSMIGKPAYILTDPEKYQVSEWGEYIAVKFIPGIDQRSLEQNNLYWACIGLIVEHAADDPEWSTKEKVHTQIRWAVKFIDKDSAVHLTTKGGDSKLYFELKSISFSKAKRKEANEYFNDAFQYMADLLGITVEELIAEAQSRMRARRTCKMCGGKATDKHHLFSNTKHNREMYGKLLDDEKNIVYLCNDCHVGGGSIPKLTEREFCLMMCIEIKSKSGAA